MNGRIGIILFLSFLVNVFFLVLGILFIAKKGGIYYLLNNLDNIATAHKKDGKNHYPPYYLHQKSQFKILPNFEFDIIFLGDSITDECEWAELLGNSNIKNRGISGDTTDRILNRLDEIIKSKPKKIFLMAGINDLISGKFVQQTFVDYQKILLEIQKKTPTTQVFIQSVLPVNNRINKFWLNNDTVIIFNNYLKKLAIDLSCQYIDLFAHLADSQNQLDARYTLDGVHLNGQAYLVWKEVIEKYVVDTESHNSM